MIEIIAKILEVVTQNRIWIFEQNHKSRKGNEYWNGISEPEQGRISMNGLRRMADLSDMQMKRYVSYLVKLGLLVVQTVDIHAQSSRRKSRKKVIEKQVPFITQKGLEFLQNFRAIQNLLMD